MSEQEKGSPRGSQIIDGYGDDNSFDRLQSWNDNLPANTYKSVDDEFIRDVWSILDTAGNLLIRKHHDYGPKNIAHSPGGALNGLRVRMHDKMARLNHLLDSNLSPAHESLRDTLVDLLNYSAIAMMVLDKTWPELPND